MKEKTLFYGAATALITPMTESGIDYDAFECIIEEQISSGISALVVLGTTGESSTINDAERHEIVKFAVRTVRSRVPLIVGTGSNCIEKACLFTRDACDSGADGALVVTPYYNKATEHGIIRSYEKISESADIPVIVYNVPSRTGVDIDISTYERLAEIKNISAIKEAGGSISKMAELVSRVSKDIDVYSGNDDMTVASMSVGALGVISVASNIMPKEISKICSDCKGERYDTASKEQARLFPFIKELFSEVNPIPIKAIMAHFGYCKNILRLPLTCMSEEKKTALISAFCACNKI